MPASSYIDGDGRARRSSGTNGERGSGGWLARGGVAAGAAGGGGGVAGEPCAWARLELAADRRTARCFQAGSASEIRQGRATSASEAPVRLLLRGRQMPRAKTILPAEPYLAAGAEEARRLGHNYVGTEHVLSVMIRDPDSR